MPQRFQDLCCDTRCDKVGKNEYTPHNFPAQTNNKKSANPCVIRIRGMVRPVRFERMAFRVGVYYLYIKVHIYNLGMEMLSFYQSTNFA